MEASRNDKIQETIKKYDNSSIFEYQNSDFFIELKNKLVKLIVITTKSNYLSKTGILWRKVSSRRHTLRKMILLLDATI